MNGNEIFLSSGCIFSNNRDIISFVPGFFDGGASYKIGINATLISSSTNGVIRYGYIEVLVNTILPPHGGSLELNPSEGTSLETQFVISTSDWSGSEDSLPFTYRFSYSKNNQTERNLIKSSMEPHITTYLPMGNITIFAQAINKYGAYSEKSLEVKVYSPKDVNKALNNIESQYGITQSSDDAYGQIESAVSILSCIDELHKSGTNMEISPDIKEMSTKLLCGACESFKVLSTPDNMIRSSSQVSYTSLFLLNDNMSTVQIISNFTTEIIKAAKMYQESNGKVMTETISSITRTLDQILSTTKSTRTSRSLRDEPSLIQSVTLSTIDNIVSIQETHISQLLINQKDYQLYKNLKAQSINAEVKEKSPASMSSESLNVTLNTKSTDAEYVPFSVLSMKNDTITSLATSITRDMNSTIVSDIMIIVLNPSKSRWNTRSFNVTASVNVVYNSTKESVECVEWNRSIGDWDNSTCITIKSSESITSCVCPTRSITAIRKSLTINDQRGQRRKSTGVKSLVTGLFGGIFGFVLLVSIAAYLKIRRSTKVIDNIQHQSENQGANPSSIDLHSASRPHFKSKSKSSTVQVQSNPRRLKSNFFLTPEIDRELDKIFDSIV